MAVEKPAAIAQHPFKSAKWDEITAGREFDPCQVPLLEMLCYWYWVADQCMTDMDDMGGLIYENRLEDMKPMPQLGIMKQASAEIRQLNKQLGIMDEAKPEAKREVSIIHVLQQNRQSRAKNSHRAEAG